MKIIITPKAFLSLFTKHKKEKIVIVISLSCFILSGIILPDFKKEYPVPTTKKSITQEDDSSKKWNTSISEQNKKSKNNENTDNDTIDSTSKISENKQKGSSSDGQSKKESEKEYSIEKNYDTSHSTGSSSEINTETTEEEKASSNSPSPPSTGSSSSPAKQPEKVWVPPVYKTVHHDAVYNTVTVVVCNYCGAEFGSAGEFQAHKDANGG